MARGNASEGPTRHHEAHPLRKPCMRRWTLGMEALNQFRQFLRRPAHESHRQIAGFVRYIFDTVSDSAYTGDPTQTDYMAGLTRDPGSACDPVGMLLAETGNHVVESTANSTQSFAPLMEGSSNQYRYPCLPHYFLFRSSLQALA